MSCPYAIDLHRFAGSSLFCVMFCVCSSAAALALEQQIATEVKSQEQDVRVKLAALEENVQTLTVELETVTGMWRLYRSSNVCTVLLTLHSCRIKCICHQFYVDSCRVRRSVIYIVNHLNHI